MYLVRENQPSISLLILRRVNKMKKFSVLLLASLFALTGCNKTLSEKYNPYRDRENDDIPNVYQTKADEFYLSNWYPSDLGPIEVYEGEEETEVSYSKTYGSEYCSVFTTVMGRFADFTYINFVAKGDAGKSVTLRLTYGADEDATNVLGGDTSFSLTSDYQIHTLKVKGTLQTRMDLLQKVGIFPEIGVSGSTIVGRFTFKDVYFSKVIPEGAILENPGVDSGDTSINVNGWKTEGWTFYTLYNDNGKTGVRYSQAAEWAFIEHSLDIQGNLNHLRFAFQNILAGTKPSVTTIHFVLRADVSRHVDEGVEYEYDEYYEGQVYTYDTTKEDEVQPDENGVTTLELSLTKAIEAIGEDHHKNGYRLVLMIESHPTDFDKYRYSRGGHMVINSYELYYEEDTHIDPYSKTGDPAVGSIELKDKEGVEKSIVYNGVRGDAYWPRIERAVSNSTHDSVITVTIKNSGENTARVGIHAGVPNDSRSDSLNNNFYPLWKNQGLSGSYFADGEDRDIPAGETISVEITVDTNNPLITSEDKVTMIQFLIDNNYGDSTLRSGVIDIVSVVIS